MTHRTIWHSRRPVDNRGAMMRAIRLAAEPSALFKGTTLTNGLRCIRTFESVNGIPFDPLNSAHVAKVKGMGVHEAIHRRVHLINGERK